MKTILATLIAIAIVASAHSAEPDPRTLDPKKPEDRATLLNIVKRSSNGKNNQAAKILAEAGHMDILLGILRTTTSYNTMGAIAQTRDERTIPVFESRLRSKPNNRYLVGSLAYVQSPKASPILVGLLKRHADSKRPSDQDMVGCLLNAILFNRCHDAIPILRQRFAACGTTSQANRKSNYALTLLSLGDPIGTSWLKRRLRDDIESRVHSWTANRLATICDWMPPRSDLVHIQDEAIMTPLLAELARGASSPGCRFGRECCRVLRVLTRHYFKQGDAGWQKWYESHSQRHPVYSQPLDRAARLCIDTFRKSLAETAKADEQMKWVDYFLRQPQKCWGRHSTVLWKLESRLHEAVTFPPVANLPPRDKREDLGLTFTIGLTSRLQKPKHLLLRKDFNAINITVCLASPTKDKKTKQTLARLAENACLILSEYETFYKSTKHAEQENPPDKK